MTSPVQEFILKDFVGVYRGISPTDESEVVTGELEVTIDKSGIKTRMATGLEIQEEDIPLSELRRLSPEEVKSLYVEEATVDLVRLTAFQVGEGVTLIFTDAPQDDEFALIVTGSMGDVLGPTILFGPQQVESGKFEELLAAIEDEFGEKGVVPRLASEGRVPSKS